MLIGTSGVSFVDTATGRPLTYCGFTEFRLLDKFFKGEGIDDILKDRQAAVAQWRNVPGMDHVFFVLRVFGMCHNICHLDPLSRPDFLSGARAVVDYAASFGFFVQYEMFADAQIVMPDPNVQRAYAQQVYDAFAGCSTVLLSKGNEWQKNGFDPLSIPDPPAPFVWTQGSALGDVNPVLGGRYACFHSKRDDGPKGQLASGDLAWVVHGWDDGTWPGTHVPTINDEPIGFAEVSIPGKRSNDTRLAYALGNDAAVHGAGGTFHSDDGIWGRPFGPVTRACAQAFTDGVWRPNPVQRYQG